MLQEEKLAKLAKIRKIRENYLKKGLRHGQKVNWTGAAARLWTLDH